MFVQLACSEFITRLSTAVWIKETFNELLWKGGAGEVGNYDSKAEFKLHGIYNCWLDVYPCWSSQDSGIRCPSMTFPFNLRMLPPRTGHIINSIFSWQWKNENCNSKHFQRPVWWCWVQMSSTTSQRVSLGVVRCSLWARSMVSYRSN